MSSERFWAKIIKRVQREQSGCHISGRCDEASKHLSIQKRNSEIGEGKQDHRPRVSRPLYAEDFVVVAGVCSVQIERRELTDKMVWRFPDLKMSVMGDCYVSDGF